jgi:chromosome segregation ATPase
MATKNEHVDFLEAENKKLNTLLQRHQEMFSSNYSYSSAVDALRKQADEKSQEAQECQKNFESAKSQLEAALSMCQAELQQARSFAQAQVAGLHMKIDSLQHDHSLSVELKDQHVASLRKEVQLLKKEHDNFKIQVNERLNIQTQKLEEKTREMQQLKREHASIIASYDQRLQTARMQYEEHLLQITAKARKEEAPQDEYWKRKIASQKREYESQLAELRKRLDDVLSLSASEKHAAIAGQTRTTRHTKVATLPLTSNKK